MPVWPSFSASFEPACESLRQGGSPKPHDFEQTSSGAHKSQGAETLPQRTAPAPKSAAQSRRLMSGTHLMLTACPFQATSYHMLRLDDSAICSTIHVPIQSETPQAHSVQWIPRGPNEVYQGVCAGYRMQVGFYKGGSYLISLYISAYKRTLIFSSR